MKHSHSIVLNWHYRDLQLEYYICNEYGDPHHPTEPAEIIYQPNPTPAHIYYQHHGKMHRANGPAKISYRNTYVDLQWWYHGNLVATRTRDSYVYYATYYTIDSTTYPALSQIP